LDFGMLSRSSFAVEVARGLPVAVTLALSNPERPLSLLYSLSGPRFDHNVSTDVVGVPSAVGQECLASLAASSKAAASARAPAPR